LGPVLNAVTDNNYSTTINAGGWMVLWGVGFANEKQNRLQWVRSGYDDVWLDDSELDPIGLGY
jgi:hypothetical protein